MTQPYNNDDAELEEIVAYLDGELSGEASARVERRLASDEDYRQELQGVERAWTALAELPMATVDDRFSRTTMSLVIEAAAEEVQSRTRALPIARWRRWISSALAASVALALGFLVFRLAWHNPNRILLADLPVIDNVDIYSQFHDVQFLRTLQDEMGGELERLSGDAIDLDAREQHFADVTSSIDGEEWLRSLNDEDRTTLRAKFNRFRDLPPAEQVRIRALHKEIVSADDARRLERTMLAYHQWLGGLSPVKQFELRNLRDANARVAQIERWASQMRDDELLTLTDEELKAFFNELNRPIKRLRESVTRSDRDDDRDRLKMLLGQEFGKWRRELVEQFEGRDVRHDWFYQAVLSALPERSRARFAGLPPHEKVERFLTWMRQHTACRGEVTQEELEEFFADELDPEMRAQLLSLPPGEMEQALRRMYRCQPKTGVESRWSWQPSEEATNVAPAPDDNDREVKGRNEGRDGDARGRGDRRGDEGRGRDDRRGEPGRPPRPGFRPPMEFGGPMGLRRLGASPFNQPPLRGDMGGGGPRRPGGGPGESPVPRLNAASAT